MYPLLFDFPELLFCMISQSNGLPDSKFYIWDMELDNVQSFDFETGRGEQDDDLGPIDDEAEADISDIDRFDIALSQTYFLSNNVMM